MLENIAAIFTLDFPVFQASEKSSLNCTTTSSSYAESDIEPNEVTPLNPMPGTDSLQSFVSLPASPLLPDPECVVFSTLGFAGGQLNLPVSGVTLTVPEGCVKKGWSVEFYLGVCRENTDRPRMAGKFRSCVCFFYPMLIPKENDCFDITGMTL